MADKKILLGMDRFLAKELADYSIELFLISENVKNNGDLLSLQVRNEIPGVETARKTSDQLRRLWLTENDDKQIIRAEAKNVLIEQNIHDFALFHFGMAINVFPIFYETCKKIGTLSVSNPKIDKQLLIQRVSETYANPSSIPRIVDRVVQTLHDWGFIKIDNRKIIITTITIANDQICSWFTYALLQSMNTNEISISDFSSSPIKLGIIFQDLRNQIANGKRIKISRNSFGSEIISVLDID
ncbi:MAG: hypothetical protein CVU43_00705 [Chloroflexi bacterium HGW-Chloroflexi-5]|jgi:hypothetical protein|nr:MAG: hypothetical protein CVU43_00705 [Chloroflexi bacterium HGW-Chloroflexi-5]